MPSISCIIAAYNSARFIDEALQSVLEQTLPAAEIIVVDDGSRDATPDIVAAYRPRVRIVRQATSGPAATRNTGIRHANGELIAFLDADDRWHREKLALQRARLDADPGVDVCVTMVQNFWEAEQRAERERLRNHPRARPVPGFISGCMLARRRVFERVGCFDETLWFADGPEWFVRADAAGVAVALLGEVLVYHRMHDNNLSRRRSADSKREFIALARARVHSRRSGRRE